MVIVEVLASCGASEPISVQTVHMKSKDKSDRPFARNKTANGRPSPRHFSTIRGCHPPARLKTVLAERQVSDV